MKELWAEVPGYDGRYQASSEGRIRALEADGSWRMMIGRPGRGRVPRNVCLFKDGRRRQYSVLRVVALAFYGERAEGRLAVYRNGLHGDNRLENVLLMTRSENGRRFGDRSRRRAVCRINGDGEVEEVYRSISSACEETGLNRRTIRKHCEGRRVRELPSGARFAWDVGLTDRG